MTTPSPRVYPFIPTPVKEIGLVPYQNHIKSIYGPYMGQGPPPILELDLCHIKSIYGPYMGHPRSRNWTLDFEPAFSQRFDFPLSPRSYFQTGQRFPIQKHITSGCMSPRSLFPTGQRFPIPKHITSGWMSPRSLFPPGQRYPIPLPVMTSLDQSEATICAIRADITTSLAQELRFSLGQTATRRVFRYTGKGFYLE